MGIGEPRHDQLAISIDGLADAVTGEIFADLLDAVGFDADIAGKRIGAVRVVYGDNCRALDQLAHRAPFQLQSPRMMIFSGSTKASSSAAAAPSTYSSMNILPFSAVATAAEESAPDDGTVAGS